MWPLAGNISGGFYILRGHDEQNNEIQSRIRENEAIQRGGTQDVRGCCHCHCNTADCSVVNFFLSVVHSKTIVKSIGNPEAGNTAYYSKYYVLYVTARAILSP